MVRRFYEIDAVRGLAIILMIIFHFFVDLDFFGVASIDLDNLFWKVFGNLVAIIFIFLVGFSLVLSYSRKKAQKIGFKKYLKRGAKIFSYGLIISFVTFLLFHDMFVKFGILHFIGLSIIISYPFVKLTKKDKNGIFGIFLLIMAIAVIAIGIFLNNLYFNFPYLFWVGFKPKDFASLDYFPIFPWIGVIMIGIYAGNLFLKTKPKVKELKSKLLYSFSFLGRHSLMIYLVHQPVLAGFILVYKLI